MTIRVARIYRYPVKGLSAEPLERVTLTPGQCLPHDRRFALARAQTNFDPARPEWLSKVNFFMLMRDEKLARLRTRFDEHSGMLSIDRDDGPPLKADITSHAGRRAIEAFFADFLGAAPTLVEAPGHAFADAKRRPNASTGQYVSIVNLASVRELERALNVAIDPVRFRANLYIDGAPAWAEFDWVEAVLRIGGARLRVVSRTTRCAATTVNPATAERDLDVPAALQREFGHNCMGVYAEVVDAGEILLGSPVTNIAG